MKTENLYTETENAGELKIIRVDTAKCTFEIEAGLNETDVE